MEQDAEGDGEGDDRGHEFGAGNVDFFEDDRSEDERGETAGPEPPHVEDGRGAQVGTDHGDRHRQHADEGEAQQAVQQYLPGEVADAGLEDQTAEDHERDHGHNLSQVFGEVGDFGI